MRLSTSCAPVFDAFSVLEPRQLLAQTFSGTDTDGDLFTIKLTGPGTFTVNDTPIGNARLTQLALQTDTTEASKLTISVTKKAAGDGRLRIQEILTQNTLGAFTAATTDITTGGQVDFQQGMKSLVLGDLSVNSAMNTAFIDKITLRDVFPDAQLSTAGSQTGNTSITLRNLGTAVGEAELACTAFIKKLSANTFFGKLFAIGGKDIAIVADGRIDFDDPGSAQGWSAVKAGGNLELGGTILGPVKSITAGSLFFNDLDAADISAIKSTASFITGTLFSDRIDTLSAKTALNIDVRPLSIGTVSAGTQIADTNIFYRAAGPSGFAIDLIKAPIVADLDIAVGNGGSIQKIKTIDVGGWLAGSVFALSVDTIKVKSDFNCNNFNLSTVMGQTYSIKSMTVGGSMIGQLDLAADLLTLKAGSAGSANTPFQILNGNVRPVDIRSIEFTANSPSNINIGAKTIGKIKAKGDLKSQSNLIGADANGVSLGSLTARELSLILTANGGVSSITAKSIVDTSIGANFIASTNITGGSGLAGDFVDSIYTVNGINAQGFSMKTFTAKGAVVGSNIRAATRIGTFTADAVLDSIIYAGRTDGFGFFATLQGFDSAGRIDAINIKRKFTSDIAVVALRNSAICAPTIGPVTVNGRISTVLGTKFGFGAKTFGKASVKDTAGATIKPTIPTSPGDFSPFTNSADFVFRIYA